MSQNKSIKTIVYYMGKPVTELTRDELIESLTFAAQEIECLRQKNEHDRNFMFEVFVKPSFTKR